MLYTGENGMVAHECILDLRSITKATGVTVDDVANAFADYGFHAPTMSFPVAGTLMVEPTESETLAEVDAFCEAMIAIRAEIDKVGAGSGPPRTTRCAMPRTPLSACWSRSGAPHTREQAAYPLGAAFRPKVWPPVRRIDERLRRPQPGVLLPAGGSLCSRRQQLMSPALPTAVRQWRDGGPHGMHPGRKGVRPLRPR